MVTVLVGQDWALAAPTARYKLEINKRRWTLRGMMMSPRYESEIA
jgi:hypothetical protein